MTQILEMKWAFAFPMVDCSVETKGNSFSFKKVFYIGELNPFFWGGEGLFVK